jgi:hypothetical protein
MSDDNDDRMTVPEALEYLADKGFHRVPTAKCPLGPHRGPQGPNEDIAQCYYCGMPTYALRPWGETFGHHADDCSLPIWHKSYCVGGGEGHPEAPVIRG